MIPREKILGRSGLVGPDVEERMRRLPLHVMDSDRGRSQELAGTLRKFRRAAAGPWSGPDSWIAKGMTGREWMKKV